MVVLSTLCQLCIAFIIEGVKCVLTGVFLDLMHFLLESLALAYPKKNSIKIESGKLSMMKTVEIALKSVNDKNENGLGSKAHQKSTV